VRRGVRPGSRTSRTSRVTRTSEDRGARQFFVKPHTAGQAMVAPPGTETKL
jgi:hypothetical protein